MRNMFFICLFASLFTFAKSEPEEDAAQLEIPRVNKWADYVEAMYKMSAKSYLRRVDTWQLTREVLKNAPVQVRKIKKLKNLGFILPSRNQDDFIAYTRALRACIETSSIWNVDTQAYQTSIQSSWCEEMKSSMNAHRFISYARTKKYDVEALLKDGMEVKKVIDEMIEVGFIIDPYLRDLAATMMQP